MKKSIVAMLSITALATVANADPFEKMTGTNFEGKQNGGGFFATTETESLGEDPENLGSYLQGYYWYASTNSAERGAQLGTYTNSQEYGSYNGLRPAIAAQANTTNSCLLVDTEGERLFRAIEGRSNYDDDDSTFVQFDVTSAIYFDSLVQFTVNEDEAPTIQTGDKLAVWLQGGETTNLVVTAGYFNSVDALVATNYVVTINNEAVTLEPGTWHRLTIEAINIFDTNEDVFVGFRIYVDGTLLNTGSAISVHQFDDLAIFDDFDPTDKATSYAQEGVLFPALYSTGDNHGSISCVAFEGTGAVDDLTFTPNDPFAGAEPAVPTVDGNEPTDGTAFIAAATSGTTNILPPRWTVENNVIKDGNGDTYATIPAFYTATLADGTLTLELNNNALPTIGAANVTVGEETEAKEAIEVGDTTFTATLTSTSTKLYYGLKVAASPNAAEWTAGELTKGTGSAMQLTANKPVDGSTVAPAAFFKVYVTDIAPTAPAPAGE